MDIGSRSSTLEESYSVTTTPTQPGPITRSVFVLKKLEAFDMFGSDNIIRYGQKLKIEANPYLFKKPLYLSS